MDFTPIISAVLAGGLAGQLVTLFWNNKAKSRQDLENWLRTERFKAFTELLALVSASAPRTDYDKWPTDIRNSCQKVHMLCPGGSAPQSLSDSMENIYQLAKTKKKGLVTDHDAWTRDLRNESRRLRVRFSEILKSNTY